MTENEWPEIVFIPIIKFPEDNEIFFYQDHNWWKNVPSDVEFKVRRIDEDSIWFEADGYGSKEHYGNGSIAISKKYLPDALLNQLNKK